MTCIHLTRFHSYSLKSRASEPNGQTHERKDEDGLLTVNTTPRLELESHLERPRFFPRVLRRLLQVRLLLLHGDDERILLVLQRPLGGQLPPPMTHEERDQKGDDGCFIYILVFFSMWKMRKERGGGQEEVRRSGLVVV